MLDHNDHPSTIKGSNTTSGTLDYWYYNNIEGVNDSKGNSYSTYIEDTVYCNDRSFNNYNESGWNPDGGSVSSGLYFGSYGRTTNPIVTCPRDIDKFTKSSSKGNGDLDYPVGLLTEDEIRMAGATGSANYNHYLWNGIPGSKSISSATYWWSFSPLRFYLSLSRMNVVFPNGLLSQLTTDSLLAGSIEVGVRPVITLSAGTKINDGDGTSNNPYIIKEG